jgi:hypothetical protein
MATTTLTMIMTQNVTEQQILITIAVTFFEASFFFWHMAVSPSIHTHDFPISVTFPTH